MKILNLASNDYANFSHDNANALRYVGIDCKDVVLHPHKFNYPSQSEHVTKSRILQLIPKYDIIQIFHSCPQMLILALSRQHKRIIVWHTGTRYRMEPDKYNELFNPHVVASFIALGEFSGLGAKNEIYSVGAIDTERITPTNPYQGRTVRIGHFPSNPVVKGTETIKRMVDELTGDFEFICDTDLVDYDEQLKRMQSCDIILELFAPEQNGKPYGSWGITALEAAAMGKVVFTNHETANDYMNTYQIYPDIQWHNKYNYFLCQLQLFIDHPGAMVDVQFRSRAWVEKYHSYRATGTRLKKILLNL